MQTNTHFQQKTQAVKCCNPLQKGPGKKSCATAVCYGKIYYGFQLTLKRGCTIKLVIQVNNNSWGCNKMKTILPSCKMKKTKRV